MSAQAMLWNGFLLIGMIYLVVAHDWHIASFLLLLFFWQDD